MATIKTNLFGKFYKFGAAALKALDAPRQQRMIERAFGAVADKTGKLKDDTEATISKLYLDLSTADKQETAEGIITKIAEAQIKLDAAMNVVAKVPAIQTAFFDTEVEVEVPEAKSE